MGAKPTKDVERYRNEAFPPPVKVDYLPGVEVIRYVTSVFGSNCLAERAQICHWGRSALLSFKHWSLYAFNRSWKKYLKCIRISRILNLLPRPCT